MKRLPLVRRHLSTESVLDYLDDRGDAASRREVEDHLALPCARCHDRVHDLGLVVGRMRSDREPEVPESLHGRALSVFQPMPRAVPRASAESIVQILFDSWLQPAPAATRRPVGGMRRLRVALDEHTIELEFEREAEGLSIRGRLEAPDPALYEVTAVAGSERTTVRPHASGEFLIQQVPGDRATVEVSGPAGRFQIPEVTL